MSYKDWQALAEQEAKVPKMIIESIDYAEKIIDHVADEHRRGAGHAGAIMKQRRRRKGGSR